jgi:hypothetical protein
MCPEKSKSHSFCSIQWTFYFRDVNPGNGTDFFSSSVMKPDPVFGSPEFESTCAKKPVPES